MEERALSNLLFFSSPFWQTPIGQLNLQDAKLEEIEGACDSDDELDVVSSPVHVFAIWPPCQAPTYLVIPTRQEKVSLLELDIFMFPACMLVIFICLFFVVVFLSVKPFLIQGA